MQTQAIYAGQSHNESVNKAVQLLDQERHKTAQAIQALEQLQKQSKDTEISMQALHQEEKKKILFKAVSEAEVAKTKMAQMEAEIVSSNDRIQALSTSQLRHVNIEENCFSPPPDSIQAREATQRRQACARDEWYADGTYPSHNGWQDGTEWHAENEATRRVLRPPLPPPVTAPEAIPPPVTVPTAPTTVEDMFKMMLAMSQANIQGRGSKEADVIDIPEYPDARSIKVWKKQVRKIVASASNNPDAALPWIMEVDSAPNIDALADNLRVLTL